MSARIWKKRRAKRFSMLGWRRRGLPDDYFCANVIDLGHERAMAERRDFNKALGWWLDHPQYTYGGLHP